MTKMLFTICNNVSKWGLLGQKPPALTSFAPAALVSCDPLIDPFELAQPLQQAAPGQPLGPSVLRWRRRKAAVQRLVAWKRHTPQTNKSVKNNLKRLQKSAAVSTTAGAPRNSWARPAGKHTVTMEQSVKYPSLDAPPTAFVIQWGLSSRPQLSTLPGNIFWSLWSGKGQKPPSTPDPDRRPPPSPPTAKLIYKFLFLLI